MRLLLLYLAGILSIQAHASPTPAVVLAGSVVNAWTQAELIHTNKPFDFAIQGRGFFVIDLPNGERAFSRYGEMSLSRDGFLLHTPSQGKVLGFCKGEFRHISLSDFSHDDSGSVVKDFRTDFSGSISGVYASGHAQPTCTLVLALFQNPNKVNRVRHVLKATPMSGEEHIGMPQSGGRGSIYSSSLEVLDEQIYGLNIATEATDSLTATLQKDQLAKEQWAKQKTLFYVYELGVSRAELLTMDASTEKLGREIKKIVDMAESGTEQTDAGLFTQSIKDLLDIHETEVRNILDQRRLDRARIFRDKFNKTVFEKYGSSLRFTGF